MNIDINNMLIWADEWGTPFNLLLFVLLFFLTHKVFSKQASIGKFVYFVCIVTILIFYIFSFWGGDWIHYYEYLNNDYSDIEQMEHIYYVIADYLGRDYLFWRLIIWGSVLFINLFTAYRLGIRKDLYIVFYICSCVLLLSYSRASLAMSLSFLGYSYLIKPKKGKIISYSVGLALILFPLSFHKSAVILIIVYLLSTVPLNKKTLVCSLIGVPLGFFFIRIIGLSNIVNTILMSSDLMETAEKFKDYSGVDGAALGPVDFLLNVFQFGSFYITVVFVFHSMKDGFINECSNEFQQIAKCIVWIVFLATLFLVSSDVSSMVLFYRTLYFAVIPISLLLAMFRGRANVLHKENLKLNSLNRYVKWNYYFFVIFSFMSLAKWFVVPFLSKLYHL